MLIGVGFIIKSRRAAIVVRISIVQQFLESVRLLDVEEKLRSGFRVSLISPLVGSNVSVAICAYE
jgi:hypothetical protein